MTATGARSRRGSLRGEMPPFNGTEIEPDISSQVFVLGERFGKADSEGAQRLVNSAGSGGHGPTRLAPATGG